MHLFFFSHKVYSKNKNKMEVLQIFIKKTSFIILKDHVSFKHLDNFYLADWG